MAEEKKAKQGFRYRLIFSIIRNSGLGYATVVFLVLFFACAAIVTLVEPGVESYFDAVWFCFQAVTTIGFGDIVIVTSFARISTMVLSLFAVFCVAVLTGAVVSYCNEVSRNRLDESVMRFMDKLERLPEMSKEELEDISEKVRKIR